MRTPDEIYADIDIEIFRQTLASGRLQDTLTRRAELWGELKQALDATQDAPLWARVAVAILADRMREEAESMQRRRGHE